MSRVPTQARTQCIHEKPRPKRTLVLKGLMTASTHSAWELLLLVSAYFYRDGKAGVKADLQEGSSLRPSPTSRLTSNRSGFAHRLSRLIDVSSYLLADFAQMGQPGWTGLTAIPGITARGPFWVPTVGRQLAEQGNSSALEGERCVSEKATLCPK